MFKHLMSIFSRNLKLMLFFTAGLRARGCPHHGDEDEHLVCHWKIMLPPSTQTQRCLAVVLETQIVLEDIQVHLNKLECHGKVHLFQ